MLGVGRQPEFDSGPKRRGQVPDQVRHDVTRRFRLELLPQAWDNASDMSAATKTKDAPKAYLITGDDDLRKQRELEGLIAEMVAPDFADFDLEQLEGDTAHADRIVAGLGIPPFSSPRRVVLVRYANKMDEDEQKRLAARLEQVPASGCLVMISPAPEKRDGRPLRGSEVIGDLSKAIRKIGRVIRVGGERTQDKADAARRFARERFAEAGKFIDSSALALFLPRVGTDFAVIKSEVDKLVDYVGDSDKITRDDVSAVTSESPEEKIFKLVDAIGTKRPAEAMAHLDDLFESGDRPEEEAPKTLSNIARQVRLVWQAKMLLEAGVRTFTAVPENLRSALPSSPNLVELVSRQAWQEKRLKGQAAKWRREDLARCLELIARTDAMLKGVEGDIDDARMAMELLVLELAT